jgi:serine/threonine protein kinase
VAQTARRELIGMSPPDNQPPALRKPPSAPVSVSGPLEPPGADAGGPPSSSRGGPLSSRRGGGLFARSTEILPVGSGASVAASGASGGGTLPPPTDVALAQSHKILAPLEGRRTSPDDDTQPIATGVYGDPDEGAEGAEGAEDSSDLAPPPPRVSSRPPPRSFRSFSIPDEFEGRISREIPPPDHVDFESGRPVDGKDPYLGTTFDKRYKIEQVIGEGGMGFVYLARHKVIDKKVAIKVLRSDMARDRENLDRFLQEARAASSIGNPHIVDISDFGDLPDGSTYFVMEYLDGGSLSHLIDKTKRLPLDRLCHIALQMAAGLAAAHECGIVHRDLKPDNVILITRGGDSDFVKILDFGIAKVMSSGEAKLTVAGAVFGTPHYMSPEQAAGTPVDHRTDIYSLGVIFYEMVSGTLPFNADNFMAILSQHMYQAPTPLREIAPECPPAIEAVILKCLSKKPEARFQSMEELAEDLRRVRAGEIPTAVSEMVSRAEGFDVPPEYFKKSGTFSAAPPAPKKPPPWAIYIASGAAVAAGTLAAVFALRNAQPPAPLPAPAGTGAVATAPPAPTLEPPPTASSQPSQPSQPPQPPPGPKKVAVGLAATPDTAMAYVDGRAIKLPSTIEVEEGKPVTVEVRAEGHETATVTLDGKELIKLVKLTKFAPAGRLPPAKTTNPEIVDPWNNRQR